MLSGYLVNLNYPLSFHSVVVTLKSSDEEATKRLMGAGNALKVSQQVSGFKRPVNLIVGHPRASVCVDNSRRADQYKCMYVTNISETGLTACVLKQDANTQTV